MREKLKSAYYSLQTIFGRDRKLLDKIGRENLVVVLNLHQVSPHQNAFWPPLSPEVFADLLAFLKDNFELLLFCDLAESRSKKPAAVLSFDDGYYNFLEYALPILDKHRVRANMNIIPACVESGQPMWNIQLYDFLNAAPLSLVNDIRLPGFNYKLEKNNSRDKLLYGLRISRFLKRRARTERQEMWQSLENVMQKGEVSLTRMMSREEVKTIAGKCEIGVHSYSHESMEFEDNTFFENDLEKCRAYFQDELKLPLDTYAFPNGSFRDEQVEILRESG
ncbi:MAG TPA: polysaccharide deacetylase family protein, partial [Pyrinomonadaceae bacterium]|nr:polysaccharide deacetylase family protein [Pyrinomonadaceae bacterium]